MLYNEQKSCTFLLGLLDTRITRLPARKSTTRSYPIPEFSINTLPDTRPIPEFRKNIVPVTRKIPTRTTSISYIKLINYSEYLLWQ